MDISSLGRPARPPKPPPANTSQKMQDGTSGGGNSPGYENIWRIPKKKSAPEKQENTAQVKDQQKSVQGPENNSSNVPGRTVPRLRLHSGWDAILFAQKKLCEKAKNLIKVLEAPHRYLLEKKSKSASLKSKGVIIDFESKDETGEEKKDLDTNTFEKSA